METPDINATRARSEAVEKYFWKTPSRPTYVLAIVLAIMALVAAIPAAWALISMKSAGKPENDPLSCVVIISGLFAAGLAFAAVFFYWIVKTRYESLYRRAEPKPPDAMVDAWHHDDIERLKRYALGRLDLIAEQVAADNPNGPLVVVGSGPASKVTTGRDGVIRFSSHDVLIIYLTTYHLAAFKCIVDLHDGAIKTEMTQEYHYNDVVSVSSETTNAPWTWWQDGVARQSPTHQRFGVSVASGEQISVTIGFTATANLALNGMFAESGADAAMRSIRTRLRQKKGGSEDTSGGESLR